MTVAGGRDSPERGVGNSPPNLPGDISSPALNGEDILASADTTPAAAGSGNASNNNSIDSANTSSPPAESVHSEHLTSLSPPPLEGSHQSGMPSARVGRPPLPPRGAPPVSQVGSTSHRRVLSTGDQSYLSALTDADGGSNSDLSPSAAAQRKRGVSWDFDNSPAGSTNGGGSGGGGAKTMSEQPENLQGSTSILQPILLEENIAAMAASGSPQQPSLAGSHRASSPKSKAKLRSTVQKTMRKITVLDLKSSPLENEAETAILEALEEEEFKHLHQPDQDRPEMAKTDSKASSSILSAVPHDAVHTFEDAGWSADYDAKGRVDGSLPEEQDAVHVQPDQREESHEDKRQPSFHNLKSVKKTLSHDRSATLSDMASTLRMMQLGVTNAVSGSIRSSFTRGKEDDAAGVPGAPPVSSADTLVNNANILFRGKSKMHLETVVTDTMKKAEAMQSSTKAKWGVLRDTVKATGQGALKKEKDANDIEMGPSQPGEGDPNDEANGSGVSASRFGRQPQKEMNKFTKCRLRTRALRQQIITLVKPRLQAVREHIKIIVFAVMLPATAVAAILFYGTDNPLAGGSDTETKASYSWWILFLCVRQVMMLSLSKGGEILWIDLLALRSPIFIKIVGPFFTLMIVQARGWPYILTFWAVLDFCFLYGGGQFSHHWLFYQDKIGLFNEENPSGTVVEAVFYFFLLIACIVAGVATAFKRLWLATFLGKRSYAHYGPELEKIMRKMLLISEVAHLSADIEAELIPKAGSVLGHAPFGWNFDDLKGSMTVDNDDESAQNDVEDEASASQMSPSSPNGIRKRANTGESSMRSSLDASKASSPKLNGFGQSVMASGVVHHKSSRSKFTKDTNLGSTEKLQLKELLAEWEEPEIRTGSSAKKASISDILQFRQAVSYMDDKHPFSPAFGPANTREKCVESAQMVYEGLLLHTNGTGLLPFETLSLLALDRHGELNKTKVKALIKLFRPDRNGFLTKLDFVKSCDNVYKELRLFRAAIANSSQIDEAFEGLVNVFHYFFLGVICLTIIGLDPWALFISLSTFILSFAFMFGSAAAKYFEGLLLIFVRRPYDIGDRVAVSDPNKDTSSNGSSTWFVEGVSLYTTTVRFATTNEVATYSNGSLANSRIINSKRSPKATAYVYLKFGIDVPYDRVKIFRTVVETFVKARPREWISLNGFRATRVEADQGFIEYVLVLQHREAWQNIGPILQSKADLSSYCLEVTKKLDMRYSAPPLPVNLALTKGSPENDEEDEHQRTESDIFQSMNMDSLADLFKKK